MTQEQDKLPAQEEINHAGYVALVRDTIGRLDRDETLGQIFTVVWRVNQYTPSDQLTGFVSAVDAAMEKIKQTKVPRLQREADALARYYALNHPEQSLRDLNSLADNLPVFNQTGTEPTGKIGVTITSARRIIKNGRNRLRGELIERNPRI